MRSTKIPCNVCKKSSCQSGFVFKSSLSKCVCKVCYNRQKRFEKVTAAREGTSTTTAESSTDSTEEQPVVINLEGMFNIVRELRTANLTQLLLANEF